MPAPALTPAPPAPLRSQTPATFTSLAEAFVDWWAEFPDELNAWADYWDSYSPGAGASAGAITGSGLTMATSRVLGRTTASPGAVEELTLSQVLDLVGSAAQGDILYRGSSGWSRLGAGTSGRFLMTQGAASNPIWQEVGVSGATGGYQYEKFGALPLAASFTAVSAPNITLTDGSKAMRVSWTASGVNNVQLYKKSAPSTPYDVCMRMRPMLGGTNVQVGIILRNSSTGRFVFYAVSPTPTLNVQEWTNVTTFSSGPITVTGAAVPFGLSINAWLRINNDGTTLTFYWSFDGDQWVSIGTRTLATFVGSCDEYGFGAVCQSVSQSFISSFDAALPL